MRVYEIKDPKDSTDTKMRLYEIDSDQNKIYIHSAMSGACVARLCKVSGEFQMHTDRPMNVPLCGYREFRDYCKKLYDIRIHAKHRPLWAKKRDAALKKKWDDVSRIRPIEVPVGGIFNEQCIGRLEISDLTKSTR